LYQNGIFVQLGIDPETFSWHALASCGNMQDDLFFDLYEEKDKKWAKQADEMCLHCPMIRECFLQGTNNDETGVWGGFYLDKGKIDKTRNAHKTEAIVRNLSARIYD
jgi:hypothetical protein